MATLAALGEQNPRFNPFLFASVGEDRNGTLVSVLSALARFGVDPWKEAATLADLPQNDAAERLDRMIIALTNIPVVIENHRGIAMRLIGLLPQAGAVRPAANKTSGLATPEQRRQFTLWAVIALILLIGQAFVVQFSSVDSEGIGSGAAHEPMAAPPTTRAP